MLLSVLENIIFICYYSLHILECCHSFQEHYKLRRQSAVFVYIGQQIKRSNSKNNSKLNPIPNLLLHNLYFYTSNTIFIVILF